MWEIVVPWWILTYGWRIINSNVIMKLCQIEIWLRIEWDVKMICNSKIQEMHVKVVRANF